MATIGSGTARVQSAGRIVSIAAMSGAATNAASIGRGGSVGSKVFSRREDRDNKTTGLEILLEHHLDECRDRYNAYIARHDKLSEQVAHNELASANRVDLLRSEMNKSLDWQTRNINAMIVKVSGTAVILMMGGLASVAWYLLTHHV
jgi:hypothetical protein